MAVLTLLRGVFAAAVLASGAAAVGDAWAAGADALARRAEQHRAAGRTAQALADLAEARRLAERAGDAALVAALDVAIADTGLGAGLGTAARRTLAERLERIAADAASGRERTAAAALNTLGSLREGAASADAYRRGAELARRAGDPVLSATARINAARRLAAAGAPAEAERMLASSAADLAHVVAQAGAHVGDGERAAFLWVAQGVALMAVQDSLRQSRGDLVRQSHDALTTAAGLARRSGDRRLLSAARGHLGALYERSGRPDEAMALAREAVFLAQEAAAPDLLYRWHWQIGRLHRAEGRVDAAAAAYEAAVHNLGRIRADLMRGYGGYGAPFREAVAPVYLELADLRLRQAAARPGTTQAQTHLTAARAAVEQLKAAELEDYFQDDCVALLRARVKGIDRLAPGTAVLYPILLPDRLELLVSLPDGLRQVTVPVGSAAVGAAALGFRRQLEQRTTSRFLPHARQLHDWLVRPVQALLDAAAVNTLVLVPDGPLRSVPLAALHDGRGYLIERYAVAVTPGLSLMEPRALAGRPVELLLAGLTQGVQGFPPLPHVATEIASIQDTLGGTVLSDETFRTERLRRELDGSPYSIVHIASHGKFESEARDSFILTHDGRLGIDQLERFVKQSRHRDEPVELLTLSACQTAAGDDRAALGLAGVAIKAGARSALASLWFINDQAASQLVSEFYRRLADGAPSKAAALRDAQLAFLKDLRYQHPGYWAAFLLIGNWL